MAETAGQVVHIRSISKKLLFIDIINDEKRQTIAFQSWNSSPELIVSIL